MNIQSLIEIKKNKKIPQIAPGDTVRVSAKVIESGKERIQPFQGVVIRIKQTKSGGSFTVRRIAYGVGVERTFPFNSPLVDRVEVLRHGKVRRAKLYYLRGRSGKAARLKEKRLARIGLQPSAEEVAQAEAEAAREKESLPEAPPETAQAEAPGAEAPKPEAPQAEPAPLKKTESEATKSGESPKSESAKAEAPKAEPAKAEKQPKEGK
jgi:large subunit ribosomal protein L19